MDVVSLLSTICSSLNYGLQKLMLSAQEDVPPPPPPPRHHDGRKIHPIWNPIPTRRISALPSWWCARDSDWRRANKCITMRLASFLEKSEMTDSTKLRSGWCDVDLVVHCVVPSPTPSPKCYWWPLQLITPNGRGVRKGPSRKIHHSVGKDPQLSRWAG